MQVFSPEILLLTHCKWRDGEILDARMKWVSCTSGLQNTCQIPPTAGRHGKRGQDTLTCGHPGKQLCEDNQAGDTEEQRGLAANSHVLGAEEKDKRSIPWDRRLRGKFHPDDGPSSETASLRLDQPTGAEHIHAHGVRTPHSRLLSDRQKTGRPGTSESSKRKLLLSFPPQPWLRDRHTLR